MFASMIFTARQIVISWILRFYTANDIVRHQTLDLVAAEIKSRAVPGAVAELGVYRGDFARRLNARFPQKTLYLFDTFEGFDERDVKADGAFSNRGRRRDFSKTAVGTVLRRMPFPAMCIVKKGWFPDTAADVDERFAFVSIDADLFAPIYAGLLYFYPRLEKGGYIFVHDYNGEFYGGAKEAVQRFCAEAGISYVPLNDLCGSVVISK